MKARFHFPLTVDEVEAFEPVQEKLKLATDTESDEKKPHLDIVASSKSCDSGYFCICCAHIQPHSLLKKPMHTYVYVQEESYQSAILCKL